MVVYGAGGIVAAAALIGLAVRSVFRRIEMAPVSTQWLLDRRHAEEREA
jgi:hypothetical protein